MFPLSTFFLWPRFKVGTQSTLYLSQLFAALPETKWRLHTQSFARIFSAKSDRLIAEIQRDRRSKDHFSASSPWFLTTDGTRAKWRSLPGALSLVQSTTMQKTLFTVKTRLVLFTVLLHQYGGVATVSRLLVTWVKKIYRCMWHIACDSKGNAIGLEANKSSLEKKVTRPSSCTPGHATFFERSLQWYNHWWGN